MKSLKQRWTVFISLVIDPWVILLVGFAIFLVWVLESQVAPGGPETPTGPPAVLVPTLSMIIALVAGVIGSIITTNLNRITEGRVIEARGQTAVRGLKLLLGGIAELDRRVHVYLRREDKDKLSAEVVKT